jgi:Mrp family chromosome partitioning ATPase
MSWFYEALLRAEKERPKPSNGSSGKIPGPSSESLLTPIESLASIATGVAESKSAEGSRGHSSGIEVAAVPALPAKDGRDLSNASSNGFRRLTLPLAEASRLVFQMDPHGIAAEQFRLLRRKLKQEFPAGAVLLITSPGAGDGKTVTSMNLSVCLASSSDKTLLIEADVRQPKIGKFCRGGIESPGIEDAWAEKAEPRQTVHLIDELSLYASLVAKVPENPSKLVNASGVRKFVAWARENFRWIVIDAPPVLPAADVVELLPLVDAALLVVRAQGTPKELARRAFEMLGKHLNGVIFNAATVGSDPYYGYGHLGPRHKEAGLSKGSGK